MTPEEELLEEIRAHPDIFHISDSGRLSLVNPDAVIKDPEVQKALAHLQEQDRHLMTLLAQQSCLYFLQPIIDQASNAWVQHRNEILKAFNKSPDEHTFYQKMLEGCQLPTYAANLLWSFLTHIRGLQEFELTVRVYNDRYEEYHYPDISPKKEKYPYIAIVYVEGEFDAHFYGEDPKKMRTSIEKYYSDMEELPPTITFALRMDL